MRNQIIMWSLWGAKKLFRITSCLLVAMLMVFCTYQYYTKDELWIEFTENKIRVKVLVPKEIVRNKDCLKFNEWQELYLPKNVHKKCPWEK